MKNIERTKKTLVFFIILLVSFSCNVAFLLQDFMPFRYYGKIYDDVSCSILIKENLHETKNLEKDVVWTGEVKQNHKDRFGGKYTALYDERDDYEFLRLIDKTIMFKQDAITENVYFCPVAIVIQVLWIAADFVLIWFLRKNKNPLP